MKATELLKRNIEALLTARHQTKKDLAQWCRKTESWLSHALKDPARGIPLKHLDRIADFFGKATYELFLPGQSSYERRAGLERRAGRDRRLDHVSRAMLGPVAAELQRMRRKGPHDQETVPDAAAEALRALVTEFEARASALLAAHTRDQASAHRDPVPEAPPPLRPPRRSRPPTT